LLSQRAVCADSQGAARLGWTSPGKSPVELVRNRIKIVGEEAGIRIQRHGRRGVAEHLLHGFDIGASGYGEAGRGVAQFVRG
jgi:hypothetical protein